MKHGLFIIIILLLFPLSILAQREKKVEAEYLYIYPENVTREEARRTALERAKIKAIADEFGTIVSQSNTTFVRNENGNSSVDFYSLGSTDVKGEWLETIGEPKYNRGITEDGQDWIKCTVKGRIREIVSSQVELIAKVLKNGTDDKFEAYEFKSGDDVTADYMYLHFKSPQDGYLAVYLINENKQIAQCLLPYSESNDPVQKIKHDEDYIFFSDKYVYSEEKVDEIYYLTCEEDNERNTICIIFSPNHFVKAKSVWNSKLLPRELTLNDFNKWQFNLRKQDKSVIVEKKVITIKSNN